MALRAFLTVLVLSFSCTTYGTPMNYQIALVDNLATGIEVNGLGTIQWDPTTHLMSGFDWDFREGDEPGGKGNVVTPSWLTGAFLGGTYGAAIWEAITGEDVFPDPFTVVIASASDNAISINGFPNDRAEFYPGGLFKFYDQFPSTELSGEGTITLRSIPAPATVALFGLGLTGLGALRRKKMGVSR
jgi:hypothetical protein